MPKRNVTRSAQASQEPQNPQKTRVSRRSVLRGAAGAGAAGLAGAALGTAVVGNTAVGTTAAAAQQPRTAAATPGTSRTQDPIVLHVRDARAGDIEVFSGTTQTSLRDRDLAARIARAIG